MLYGWDIGKIKENCQVFRLGVDFVLPLSQEQQEEQEQEQEEQEQEEEHPLTKIFQKGVY